MSYLARIILIITAIAPVLLTHICVLILTGEMTGENILVICSLILFGSFLVIVCYFILKYAKNNLERHELIFDKVELADKESVSLFIFYLLPLIKLQHQSYDFYIFLLMIIILIIVLITSNGYHFNPLLSFLRWRFYKISTKEGVTYILITKKIIRNTIESITVLKLTEYTLICEGDI